MLKMRCGKVHLLLFIWAMLASNVSIRGDPLPFSDIEQVEMLLSQNELRRNQRNQVNMQCLMRVDPSLTAAAQNMANTCNPSQPTNTTNGFAWYLDPANGTAIQAFITQVNIEYAEFNYGANQCSMLNANSTCTLFRQTTWYEGGNLGCGRATCPGGTLTVCAYTFRQNPRNVPYLTVPNGQPCMVCPSGMSCIRNLCCNVMSTMVNPMTPSINCSTPTSFVPLVRLFDNGANKNFLLTEQADIAMMSSMPRTQNLGTIGRLARTNSTCQYALPVHRLYNRMINSESTVVDPVILRHRLASGWRSQGVMGFAVQGQGVCNANVAIYEFYNPGVGVLQVQQGPDISDLINTFKFGVYEWRGISYYVW